MDRLATQGPDTALHAAPRPGAYSPDQPPVLPGWFRAPWARAVGFLVWFVAIAVLAGLALVDQPVLGDVGYPLVQLLASLGGYLVLACWQEFRRPPVELAPRRVAGVALGLGLGAGVMLLVFGLCWACGWRTVVGTNDHAPLLLPALELGVIAGVSEEVLFRGVLFRMAEAALGTWGAAGLSAAVFGAVHLTNPDATWWGATAIALEAGVMFALLYATTRSLWVVIGVHAAWNVVQGPVLGSAVSGATANGDGLVRSFPAGPSWLSGGGFGLEASAVAVVVWLSFSLWLARRLVARGEVVPPVWVRHRRARQLPDLVH